MNWLAINLISAFLLPPLSLVLLGLAGVLVLKNHPGMGKLLLAVTLSLLYLLSTPFVAETALQTLEAPPLPGPACTASGDAQAIVVLGGGTYFNAPEYRGHTVGHSSLERIRYAARLYRLTGKPILVTGGNPLGIGASEASQMKAALENDFQIPVRWIEGASGNTRENAYYSFALLKQDGVSRICLVTHAWHMPRAAREFEQAGFKVTHAATVFTTRRQTDLLAFIPTVEALQKSRLFLHEIIGMLWYRLIPVSD